jgi:hypothetical protein
MTEPRSNAAHLFVVLLMIVPSISCMPFSCAPSWGNVITDYTVVRPDGSTGSFGGGIDDNKLERVLGFRDSFDPAAWIRSELVPQDEYEVQRLDEMGEEWTFWVYSDVVSGSDGFCHAVDQNRLCNEVVFIDAIDLYLAYLVMKGPDDEEIWRTRIPFMEVPIYPYVVDRFAMFVAGRSLFSSQVVIVDITRGKVVDRWGIPGWNDFAMMAPVETYPYFTDGHIVVQGSKAVWPKPNSDEEFRYVPQEIYVLKTTIESGDR